VDGLPVSLNNSIVDGNGKLLHAKDEKIRR